MIDKSPRTPASLHRRISMLLKICLVIGAVALFLGGQYQAAMETLIILCITFMPYLLHSRFHVKIPYEFESLAILFVCMSLFLGEVMDFYDRYWWWDVMLHTQSGFLLGITGFLLVYVLNENENINFHLSPGFMAFFACMFAIGIGALWEIFEYTMDQTFGLNMQKSGLHDTMWDLIVDSLGAATIAILGFKFLKSNKSDSFLERWIYHFVDANPRMFGKSSKNKDSGQL